MRENRSQTFGCEGWVAGVTLSKEEIAFTTGILNKLMLID